MLREILAVATPASIAPRRSFRIAAPDGVGKISPVAASRAYLEHFREAWNSQDAGRAVSRINRFWSPCRHRSTLWRAN